LNPKIRNISRVVIIVVAAALVLSLLGLGVAHPQSGLKSALGPADSSIAIYYKTNNVGKGSKALVITGQKNTDPVLALVKSVDKDFVHIQSGTMLQSIDKKKSVKGKLIVVIPFIGYLFNLIGL